MNFTPKKNVGLIVMGVLAIAAVGLIGRDTRIAPLPIVATSAVFAPQAYLHDSTHTFIMPAVELAPADSARAVSPPHIQLASDHWYGSKHWWKRNAPIVGGAGAGALIGGLAGGGTGALIGGEAGGGAGYLYKRSRHHSHHHHYNEYR